MNMYQSDFVRILVERGHVYQATHLEELDSLAGKTEITGYIGFDLTAPSLHVGHLTQIMMLRRLQKAGGRPIALLGGGTSKIGDPSDKDKARPLLDAETLEANAKGIKTCLEKLLDFEGSNGALLLDNAVWLDDLDYIPFLRSVGRHFTINKMIQLESVKRRLDREQPLTFLEFNYMLLQAYDFLELYQRTGCRLQMGGSDQWGNIVQGVDLVRRIGGEEVFGLTTPLITTASGVKMGKTAQGAVWLDPERLSPYEYWQFWRNTEDADVGRFLRLFTDLTLGEIETLENLEGQEINEAKKRLAYEATALLHGEEAAQQAEKAAQAVFEKGGDASGLPTLTLEEGELAEGFNLMELAVKAGLVASRGEAKRHVRAGALKLNDIAVTDLQAKVYLEDFYRQKSIRLGLGKKRHVLLELGT